MSLSHNTISMTVGLAASIAWILPPHVAAIQLSPPFDGVPPTEAPEVRNDDDNERDPAKRRRFTHELSMQRINACFLPPEGRRDAPESIPEAEKEDLLDKCAAAAPGVGRPRSDTVRWGAGFHANADGTRYLDGISAEWSTAGAYSVFASRRIGSDHICIRVGVPAYQRVNVKAFGGQRYTRPKEELNLDEAQRMLRFLLGRKPDSEDILARGHLIVADGIPVFVALQGRRKPPEGDDQGGQPPVDPTDVLITDSDPQYISMSFDLRENP